MNLDEKKIYVKENYLYMLDKLKMSYQTFTEKSGISPSTERRIRNGNPEALRDSTIEEIVSFYNENGTALYPHRVDLAMFKYEDLSLSTSPQWQIEDVTGDYIALYLCTRGTGKPKAMAIKITENYEVRAIDIVHDPTCTSDLITDILNIENFDEAKNKFNIALHAKYASLRGSRFLHGTVSGKKNLLSLHLTDGLGYEMTINTLLTSYLDTRNKSIKKYSWRGGVAIASVCDLDDWPYTMILGMIEQEYWHPEKMPTADISDALMRLHSYQKKHNMLCLQNDTDSLWYEAFMDVHRQWEEKQR